jgi:glycosyltransferase involved in cell wall biosynthesis
MKILHLLPTLEYSGASRQVLTLAPSLLRRGHDVVVCALGSDGPWGQRLRAQGVAVHALRWTRAIDPTPLWKLHRLLDAVQPDVIHAWRAPVLRTLALVGKKWLPRTIVSRVLFGKQRKLGRLDRWLLRRVRSVAVSGLWERERLVELGLEESKLALVPPGVQVKTEAAPSALALPSGPRVAVVGPLEAHKGVYEAMWTLDMLGFSFHDLQLVVIGTGPEEARLRRFAGQIPHGANVHFVGPAAETGNILAQVDICWIPSLADGGCQAALEAQAAGCAVIASALPSLREVIASGTTGIFVPPGDKVALARATRDLLVEEPLRRRLGAAGKAWAGANFPAQAFVERCAQAYQEAA